MDIIKPKHWHQRKKSIERLPLSNQCLKPNHQGKIKTAIEEHQEQSNHVRIAKEKEVGVSFTHEF